MRPRLGSGLHPHLVSLENPGDPVSDGEGGYTEVFIPLTPSTWYCAIQAATARDLERVVAGTVQASATHLVRGVYHPGITTETRILFENRILQVQSVQNIDERDVESLLVCSEIEDTSGSAQRAEDQRLDGAPSSPAQTAGGTLD